MPLGSQRSALTFIFITVLVDMIGFGIIIPVLPGLMRELTGEELGGAAVWGGWLLFVYAAMQFVFAPIIGNLSDRFGRRPVLLVSLTAFGVDYLLMGLAPHVAWLFVGRMIAGITGATHATANAYIADVSPPEKRAQNFGLLGVAFGLGFILGPVLGGLLGEFGHRVPFFASAALAIANAAYGFLVLPETLPPERRRPFVLRRANPLGALGQMRLYPAVPGLFAVLVFYMIAHDANPSTWSYYTMLKFDWTLREIGYSLGFVGLCIALVQGLLIRWVIPRLGESWTVAVGLMLMSVGYLGFAFSETSWMLYAAIVPFSLGALASPALRGILSNRVPANAQGELSGALASVMSLTAVVSPLFMTQLFGFFTSAGAPLYFPGAPFLAAALLVATGLCVFAVVLLARPAVGSVELAKHPEEIP